MELKHFPAAWPQNRERFLLIVPYGIETANMYVANDTMVTFNRTLWNWNKASHYPASFVGIF